MKKSLLLVFLLSCSTLYGQGLKLISLHKGKVVLEGKNESCKITMSVMAEITYTNCKQITNSKNVRILCTKRKSMCKTEREVDKFIYSDDLVSKKKKSKLPNLQDMSYYKARKIIINAGYTPKINPHPSQYGQAKKLYQQGYVEIDDCAGSPIMPCQFHFNTGSNKILIVDTYTREPNLLDVFVTNVYFQ